MDVESLKQDVVAGKIDVDRLIGLIDKLSKKLDVANQRIEELEKQLAGPTTKLDEAFSVESEEKRQEARGKKSKRKETQSQAEGTCFQGRETGSGHARTECLPRRH